MTKTHQEILEMLFKSMMEMLARSVRQKMPETGPYRKLFVTGTYDKSGLQCMVSAEPSHRGADQRVVSVGAFRGDRVVSNYMFTGTNAQVCTWLEDPEHIRETALAYEKLEETARDWD